MTGLEIKKLTLAILEEIDELMAGSEKCITRSDDPSGVYNEWVLDSEEFRKKLHYRVESLRNETSE